MGWMQCAAKSLRQKRYCATACPRRQCANPKTAPGAADRHRLAQSCLRAAQRAVQPAAPELTFALPVRRAAPQYRATRGMAMQRWRHWFLAPGFARARRRRALRPLLRAQRCTPCSAVISFRPCGFAQARSREAPHAAVSLVFDLGLCARTKAEGSAPLVAHPAPHPVRVLHQRASVQRRHVVHEVDHVVH